MPTQAALAAALRAPANKLTSEQLSTLMHERESAPPAATLQDIYGYIDNVGNNAFAITPNQMPGGEQGWGTTGLGLTQADTQANNGADGNMPQSPVNFAPPDLFRAGVSLSPNSSNNEGSGGYHFNVDGSKFPTTRFGDVTRTAPVGQGVDLYRPDMVYDDPNYGRITDARNVKPDQLNAMAGPAIMAAATMGMGLLGAPAIGAQLVGLARGISEGGLRGGAGGLASILGSAFGLPSWATNIGRTALSAALRNREGG